MYIMCYQFLTCIIPPTPICLSVRVLSTSSGIGFAHSIICCAGMGSIDSLLKESFSLKHYQPLLIEGKSLLSVNYCQLKLILCLLHALPRSGIYIQKKQDLARGLGVSAGRCELLITLYCVARHCLCFNCSCGKTDS